MNCVGKIVGKLEKMTEVQAAFIPTHEELNAFFNEEKSVGSTSGMPMINLSLIESIKRTHHIIIIQKDIIEHKPFHSLTMVTEEGKTVGFDVPKGMEYEVEGRNDLIWLSEDFVLEPDASIGDVSIVMHPMDITILNEKDGVKNAILMFPAPSVDDLIRYTYGIKQTKEYNSAILSFDEIE